MTNHDLNHTPLSGNEDRPITPMENLTEAATTARDALRPLPDLASLTAGIEFSRFVASIAEALIEDLRANRLGIDGWVHLDDFGDWCVLVAPGVYVLPDEVIAVEMEDALERYVERYALGRGWIALDSDGLGLRLTPAMRRTP
ncbi:hypothetical protein D3I60_04445 [Brevibacterium permense]|uniref:hypothetical protein n=1 Tax=Brevibacterium permense TaxID=234834 RepID=UPI0021CFF419|nr:hypothetical protein [Brevibacterium permense]MCU4296336.1 hypothetical protein [Brevibacterium permense]